MKLNLGCGKDTREGYVNIDMLPGPGVDVVLDLNTCKLPYQSDSIDEIYLSHVLEHIIDRYAFMIECHRVLKPKGSVIVKLPVNRFSVAHQSCTHGKGYFAYMSSDKWDEAGRFFTVAYEKRRLRHVDSLLHRFRNWFLNLFSDEWEYRLVKP